MKIFKAAAWLVLVFAVGVGGVVVGAKVRDRMRPAPQAFTLPPEIAGVKMPLGDPWPEVPLISVEGDTINSLDLVEGGGVVLFLDPHCEPCGALVRRWQEAVNDGAIPLERVSGITYAPPEMIVEYRSDYELTLPIYWDAEQIFRQDYDVRHFPLAVVVGESGFVRWKNYDSVSALNMDEIERQLAR